MFVIIAGCGTVGRFLLDRFTAEDADVTVIEQDPDKVKEINDSYDVLTIQGDILSHYLLRNANTAACDLFIACSNVDSINIVACQLAKRLGAIYAVARVYSEDIFPIDVEHLEQHLGVDWLVSPSRLAGFKFAASLIEGQHLVLDSYFSNKLQLGRLIVSTEARLNGKKLDKIFRSKKINVISVFRDGKNILNETGRQQIICQPQDEIIICGTKHRVLDLCANLYQKEIAQAQKIYIAGNSKPIFSILQFLGSHRKQVVLFEKDLHKCEEIKNQFNDISVLHVDPSQYQELRSLSIDTRGVFICGSADDADNLTYALNAEEIGFTHIVPVVHGIDKIRFFKRLGYQKIICPTELAGREIFRYFDENIKKDFDLIPGSHAKAIIKEIDTHTPGVGKPLDFIKTVNEELYPIAVWRDGHIFLPQDKDYNNIQIGDRILIASLSGREEELLKFLA